jgi:hypothetical protein
VEGGVFIEDKHGHGVNVNFLEFLKNLNNFLIFWQIF